MNFLVDKLKQTHTILVYITGTEAIYFACLLRTSCTIHLGHRDNSAQATWPELTPQKGNMLDYKRTKHNIFQIYYRSE